VPVKLWIRKGTYRIQVYEMKASPRAGANVKIRNERENARDRPKLNRDGRLARPDWEEIGYSHSTLSTGCNSMTFGAAPVAPCARSKKPTPVILACVGVI